MKQIYLDNAATTPLHTPVWEAMQPYFLQHFGNPSSIHAHGRAARSAIEKARKTIADLLCTSPAQIFFTSGGTEADNTALWGAIKTFHIKHAVTTPLEHHAVLHTLQHVQMAQLIQLHLLQVDNKGVYELTDLEKLLQKYPNTLVSLMHGNNEIGNLADLQAIGELCRKYHAYFHSDTVQTVGHYEFKLNQMPVDYIAASAHKFHGPKGVGFLYVNEGKNIQPFIHGGAQERNMRGGTENVAAIVGMAKALELAYSNLNEDKNHILSLKNYFKNRLLEILPDIQFNGLSANQTDSLYTVLSVLFPQTPIAEMLLFNLDVNKISVSGGSACTSGTNIGSHVLHALYGPLDERPAVRFSFSRMNTYEELDFVLDVIKKLFSR